MSNQVAIIVAPGALESSVSSPTFQNQLPLLSLTSQTRCVLCGAEIHPVLDVTACHGYQPLFLLHSCRHLYDLVQNSLGGGDSNKLKF